MGNSIPAKQYSNSSYIDEILIVVPRVTELPFLTDEYSGFSGAIFNILPASTGAGYTTEISFLDMVENNTDNEEDWEVSGCPITLKNTKDFSAVELLAVRTLFMDYAKDPLVQSAFERCANLGKTVEIYMDDFVHFAGGQQKSWGDYNETENFSGGVFSLTDNNDVWTISLNPYWVNGDMDKFKQALTHEILHMKWPHEWQHERLIGAQPGATDNIFGTSPLDSSRFDKGLSIMGSDQNDTLNGVANALNSISGSKGNDVINGHAKDDYLDGGLGDDVLWGGLGNDILVPGLGEDDLHGGYGDDSYLFLVASTLNNIYDEGGSADILYLGVEAGAYVYNYTDGSNDQVVIGTSSYTTTYIENGQTTGRIESIIIANGSSVSQFSFSNFGYEAFSNDPEMINALSNAGVFDDMAIGISSNLFI